MSLKNWRCRVMILLGAVYLALCGGCAAVNPMIAMRSAADGGQVAAMHDYALGALYTGNDSGVLDYNQAYEYFRKAADNGGDAKSGVYAAWLLHQGEITAPDNGEAEQLLKKFQKRLTAEYAEKPSREAAYLLSLPMLTDDAAADKLLAEAARELYYPAVIELALRNLANAPNLRERRENLNRLRLAAERGYVAANYFLSEQYEAQEPETSQYYLTLAANKKYPPAVFKQAKNTNNSAAMTELATKGYGPAIYYLALAADCPAEKRLELLQTAWRKNVTAAGNRLLDEYINRGWYGAAWLMACRVPDADKGLVGILDNRSGLYFPAQLLWRSAPPEAAGKWNDAIYQQVDAGAAGIATALEVYRTMTQAEPAGAYYNLDWAYVKQKGLPGEWLQASFAELDQYQNQAAYWCSYALAASKSGQGMSALYGVFRWRGLGVEGEFAQAAVLVEANGYMLLGRADMAYETLLKFGRLDNENEHLKNLVRNFLPMLLKFPARFEAAAGLTIEPENYLPVEPESFYDVCIKKVISGEADWDAPLNVVEVPWEPIAVEE